MPGVLLVEDDEFQRQVVEGYLATQGFTIHAMADAEALRAFLANGAAGHDLALAVLDVNLPGEDGLSLARWLRAERPGLGIVMLTAAGDTLDRILGLECGADDYIPKPYAPRELLARLRAVLRRSAAMAPQGKGPAEPARAARIRVGIAMLDLERRTLAGPSGAEEPLTLNEFELLRLLVENPNRPLHRDWLLERTASGEGDEPLERAVDLRIMRLRRKIETDPSRPTAIRTVRGVGYMYVPMGGG